MNASCFAVVGSASNKAELLYIWDQATFEAKVIIVFLMFFSVTAWSVMAYKAIQMRRAKKLNQYFTTEFKTQKAVLDLFDRRIAAEGCPLFAFCLAVSSLIRASCDRFSLPADGERPFKDL